MTNSGMQYLIDELVQSWSAPGNGEALRTRRIEARAALEQAIARVEGMAAPHLLETLRVATTGLWCAGQIPRAKHVQAVLNEATYAGMAEGSAGASDEHETHWNPESESSCSYS